MSKISETSQANCIDAQMSGIAETTQTNRILTSMIAETIETNRITSNIKNVPSLLAIVMAMLRIRFLQVLEDVGVAVDVQRKFLSKMEQIGDGVKGMQNCEEKPALSLGQEHIQDQMAIIRLPGQIAEVFELVGILPAVEIQNGSINTFMSTNKHHLDEFYVRTGIKLNVMPKAD